MKKLLQFIKKNYFLFIFAFVILFVALFSSYKLFVAKPIDIYVKVKLGQGLWWASTAEPPLWLVNSLNVQTNSPNIKIIKINYYPYLVSGTNTQSINQYNDQYNVYLTLKLKATTNKSGDVYYFNRSEIAIGSPIDLAFSDTQVSGVIIAYSNQIIINKLADKIIFLTKNNPDSWEYEAIKTSDYYFDGENKAFQIIDKEISSNNSLTVKAKIKIKEINNRLIFGEDRIIAVGKIISIFTNNFSFNNYIVSRID